MKDTDKNLCCYVFLIHRWQFASEGSDIGFGLFLKTKGNDTKKREDMQEIIPIQRYNSHLVPEDGSHTCEDAGICESLLHLCTLTLQHFFTRFKSL